MLNVACNRCARRGSLRTDRLLAEHEHEPDMPIPKLLRIIAVDCPRMVAQRTHDVCGVHLPGLGPAVGQP